MSSTLQTPRRRRGGAVPCLVLTVMPFSALAFQPLITDDTGTQGAAGNQLEFSLGEDRTKTAGLTERMLILPFVYTRGLTESIDFFAGLSYGRLRTSAPGGNANGGRNPSIGAKWRFYEEEASPTTLAIKPEILFPVSRGRESDGLGTGKTSGNLTLIVTQEVPFGAVHLNFGVGRNRYRDRSTNPDSTSARASIAPVWDITENWKLALDLGAESSRAGGERVRTSFVELGTIYSPGKELDFAVGLVRASDNEHPRTTTHTANVGLTWRFK